MQFFSSYRETEKLIQDQDIRGKGGMEGKYFLRTSEVIVSEKELWDSTANAALPQLKFCKIKILRQFQTNAD